MKYYLIIVLLLLSLSGVKASDDKDNVESNDNVLILDVSNTMRGDVAGESKINILKSALSDFVEQWPENEKLAVIAYGMNSKRESCERIRTLNAATLINKEELLGKINKLKPRGRSPMISAIYKAERQLKKRKGNIILVSDGGENCRKKISVCDISKRMKHNHPDIRIHTIDMSGDNKTLRCIADVTGGEYHTIRGLQDLGSSLFSVDGSEADTENSDSEESYVEHTGRLVLHSVETLDGEAIPASYIIYTDAGKHVASYTAETEVEKNLPVGKYTVMSIHNLSTQEVKLQIGSDDIINHTFVMGRSGELNLSAKYRGKPASTLYTIYDSKGVELLSNVSDKAFTQTLPVGSYKVEAQHDGDMKVITFDVEQNNTKHVQIRF